MNDLFTEAAVRRYTALPVRIFDCVPSTNTLARELAAAGAPHGTVIAAAAQSAGRGRLGRSFASPAGTGLYVSVILRPDFPAEQIMRITTAAAVALCRALESMGVRDTSIKWVNDVFRGPRKIAGILTEAAFASDGTPAYAVLGVGVNLSPPPQGFPPEIAEIAGAAFDAPIPDGRARLLGALLDEFFALYGDLAAPRCAHMDEYRRRCFVIGRDVTVIAAGGTQQYAARAAALDDECRLIVHLPSGEERVLATGEVSLRM